MLKRELQRAEEEARRSQSIIVDYKQICSQLGRRLEEQQSRTKDTWQQWKSTLSDCPKCSALVDDLSSLIASDQQPGSPDHSLSGSSSSAIDSKRPGSPTSPTPFEMQVGVYIVIIDKDVKGK